MSPNEFDLRAALHDGEGDSVDADRLIAHAMGVRHARRVRLATIAAAVVAVGGIGVGATVLTDHSHRQVAEKSAGSASAASGSAAAGSGYAQYGTERSAPTAAALPVPADSAMRDPQPDMALSTQCPPTPPRLMVPGGGGSGQFGSTGPLFPGPVASMTVCGYAGGTGSAVPAPVPLVLDAKQAAAVAASLNAASTTVPAKLCPAEPPGYRPTQLVLMAVGAEGKAMEPVVVTSGCIGKATNGTAVRYDWQPPTVLSAFIAKLEAPTPVSSAQLPSSASPSFAAPPAPSASPRVSGSPAR